MAESEIDARIRELVWKNAPVILPAPPADGDDLVDVLGYHSLTLTELALALSDEFGFDEIRTSEFEDIKTVGDVIKHVRALSVEPPPIK